MPVTTLGVVVLCYRSSDVIVACLDSLLASEHEHVRIVVCDNASPDDTVAKVRAWAADRGVDFAEHAADGGERPAGAPLHHVTLLRSARNLGFAGGVNLGLGALTPHPEIDLFWVLNPDTVVTPGAASAFARAAATAGPFSLMGGRTIYLEPPNYIQSDGGRINRWTGVCRNENQGVLPADATLPDPDTLDFISGANMVASRPFLETTGLMREDYFLYYEEVDWAFRRGDLPLAVCPEAIVYHHGGTTIGTGSLSRRPSGFANYYNFRNRMLFVGRFLKASLPISYAFSMMKVVQLLLLHGAWSEAVGALRGLHQLSPPAAAAPQRHGETA